MYYLHGKQFLFAWRCRHSTRMRTQIKKYLKIQDVFELHGQWKLENQTFTHYSNQNLPLDSQSLTPSGISLCSIDLLQNHPVQVRIDFT